MRIKEEVDRLANYEGKRGAYSSQMKKVWAPNVVLLTLALLSGLFIAECATRIFLPLYPSIYQPDALLLHKLVPNSKEIFVREKGNGGQKITVTINSLGFRGEEFPITPKKKRVIVYGDSLIEGEYSSLENTFVKQLEKRLNSTHNGSVGVINAGVVGYGPDQEALGMQQESDILKPNLVALKNTSAKQLEKRLNSTHSDSVEVINAGVVGYGPDQEALRMQQESDILKPNLVVVAIYPGNDFGDLLRDKIYRLDANNQLVLNHYYLSASLWSEMTSAAFPKGLYHLQFFRRLKKVYSRLVLQHECDSIEESLKCSKGEYVDYVLRNNNEVTNLFYDHYDADIALTPDAPSSQYKINLMEKVVLKIHQITDSRGIPMVLLIIPSPIDVCNNYDYQVDQNKYKQYKRSRLTDIMETIAKQHGIKYVNLFPFFRQNDCNKLYFHGGDDHWNDEGQRLAAKLLQPIINSELRSRAMVSPSAGPSVSPTQYPPVESESRKAYLHN